MNRARHHDAPARVGLLGVGQRGLQHLQALWGMQKDGLVNVVALCDAWADNLTEAKIRRFVPDYVEDGAGRYTDFDAMLNEATLDAIYFCLPPGVHRGEVIRAARAGVHVFVEKPMSLYYDEAVEMENVIRESGVISCVGFQLRYDRRLDAIKTFLADKKIVFLSAISHGTLESHSVKHTHTEELGGPGNRVWTANFEWSGSAMVEAGIHPLDRMRYLCGDIAWVQSAYVPRDPEDIENDGNNPYVCVANFGFRNGALGALHYSKLRRVFRTEGDEIILWSHGQIKMERDGPVAYYYDGTYPPPAPPDGAALRHPLAPDTAENSAGINETFINAARTGDGSAIRSPFSESMNSLAAVLAANASNALDGERIYLDRFASEERYARFRIKPNNRRQA